MAPSERWGHRVQACNFDRHRTCKNGCGEAWLRCCLAWVWPSRRCLRRRPQSHLERRGRRLQHQHQLELRHRPDCGRPVGHFRCGGIEHRHRNARPDCARSLDVQRQRAILFDQRLRTSISGRRSAYRQQRQFRSVHFHRQQYRGVGCQRSGADSRSEHAATVRHQYLYRRHRHHRRHGAGHQQQFGWLRRRSAERRHVPGRRHSAALTFTNNFLVAADGGTVDDNGTVLTLSGVIADRRPGCVEYHRFLRFSRHHRSFRRQHLFRRHECDRRQGAGRPTPARSAAGR